MLGFRQVTKIISLKKKSPDGSGLCIDINYRNYLNFLISPLCMRAKYEFISRLTIGARK